MKDISRRLTALFASRRFFYVVVGGFTLSALWFVFSALYPLAFDEDFHLGVIRIYAEQWSPFLSGQPAQGDAFGSLATDPSYLYHYIMSFPYRFLQLFTQSETIIVIWLRLINVAIVAASLFLYRKVMLRAGASAALTHVALALFVLIPIVPQLAAHINYDNAFMLLLAWLCLVTFNLIDSLRDRRVDVRALLLFIVLCLGISIVKYAALPLLAAAALFVAWTAYRSFKGAYRKLGKSLLGGYKRLSRATKIVLLVALAVGVVLFAQRYVVNIAKYGTPVPDCGKVLTVDQCKQYGPWGRDYTLEQSKNPDFQPSIGYFMSEWVKGMLHRLFFAVSGARTGFVNYIELPIPRAVFAVLTVIVLACTALWWTKVFRGSPYLVFFAAMIGVYLAILIFDQYGMYKQTSVPVAINGRYLLPILPLAAVIAGKALAHALSKYKAVHLKPYLAAVTILLFLQGGGMLTYLLRADPNWYWPNQTVRDFNEQARKIATPFVIEGDKFKPWH